MARGFWDPFIVGLKNRVGEHSNRSARSRVRQMRIAEGGCK
jgi:hypothetical protein